MPTHWKKLTNPDFLGAYAFEPHEEKIGTIANVEQETVIGADGKSAPCTVIHFAEADLKPLICNSTNAKAISKLCKTPYIEEWAGHQIIMRVQPVRAFGEVVDAIRIKPELPARLLCADCKSDIKAYGNYTPQQMADYTKNKYGRQLCSVCAGKASKA